jgi:Domain of unknown function (DUF4169)
MAEIVNLRKMRKAKSRAEAARRAAENRARFGATKTSKDRDRLEAARDAHAHEQKKLDRPKR